LLAFFHLVLVPAETARDVSGLRRRRMLLVSVAAIAVLGGARIFTLHADMRRCTRSMVRSRLSLSGAPPIAALLEIPWFAPFAREKLPHYTVATALFPDFARGEGGKYRSSAGVTRPDRTASRRRRVGDGDNSTA
jgi:hypothetical protein